MRPCCSRGGGFTRELKFLTNGIVDLGGYSRFGGGKGKVIDLLKKQN
jgi:hypothetical protein